MQVLQSHFFESHLIIGRPLMYEEILKEMINSHRYALAQISPNEEVWLAAKKSPLLGCITTPTFYSQSKTHFLSANSWELC